MDGARRFGDQTEHTLLGQVAHSPMVSVKCHVVIAVPFDGPNQTVGSEGTLLTTELLDSVVAENSPSVVAMLTDEILARFVREEAHLSDIHVEIKERVNVVKFVSEVLGLPRTQAHHEELGFVGVGEPEAFEGELQVEVQLYEGANGSAEPSEVEGALASLHHVALMFERRNELEPLVSLCELHAPLVRL